MKKRLYWIIFSSLTGFFLFLIIILHIFFNFNISNNFNDYVELFLFYIIFVLVGSHLLRFILIKNLISPLNALVDYISKIVLDKHISEEDEIIYKDELMSLLKKYGYNFDDIKKALELVTEKNELRRNFSANVSHELKSPLTSINGYAELIYSGIAKNEEAAEFGGRILKEGNRLLKMIDEIIQLSKIDNNQIKNESFIELDIGNLIKEVIENLHVQIEEKNIKVKYKYKKLVMLGNERLLYDLIRNLVSNAIKYSSKVNPEIEIEQYDFDDYIKLKFKDNGIGISEEDQKRIFERFYVVDKSRGNKTGTGLGLALVKNITNIHSGEVKLDSVLGLGSVFTIILPKNL